jgi:peptide subunit release factor 1 (eRF1)
VISVDKAATRRLGIPDGTGGYGSIEPARRIDLSGNRSAEVPAKAANHLVGRGVRAAKRLQGLRSWLCENGYRAVTSRAGGRYTAATSGGAR